MDGQRLYSIFEALVFLRTSLKESSDPAPGFRVLVELPCGGEFLGITVAVRIAGCGQALLAGSECGPRCLGESRCKFPRPLRQLWQRLNPVNNSKLFG